MKKRKVALALGLCLAVGLCGASLVACGDDDGGDTGDNGGELVISTTEKSDYYLFGSSKSEIFESAYGTWKVATATTADEIPDSIAVWKTNKANTYAVETSFYKGDEFAFLLVGQEYAGQLAAGYVVPTPHSKENGEVTGDEEVIGTKGGGAQENICINKDGKYRFVIHVSDDGSTVTYERIGNPDPLATQYNYWVLGENLTHGKAMYNGLTQFIADSLKTNYTVTVNLKENEKISILAAATTEGNKGVNIDNVTLKAGAEITAVAAAQAEEEVEAPVAPAGPVYQYQAGEAGSYTITIAETDVVDTATNSVTTSREINATKAALVEYEFKLRASSYKDGLKSKYEYDFELNEETGLYEYSFTVEEKPATLPAAPETAPAHLDQVYVGDTFNIDVVKKGETLVGTNKVAATYNLRTDFLAPWSELSPSVNYSATNKVNAVGNYKITVDPNSFEVTVTREGDPAWSYDVYAHGTYGGAEWADNAVKGVATDGAATTEITLALKAGDEFGFRTYHSSNANKAGDQLDWGHGTIAGVEPGGDIIAGKISAKDDYDEKNDTHSAGNFTVKVAGTYKFTITVDEDGKITSITAVEVTAPAPAPEE